MAITTQISQNEVFKATAETLILTVYEDGALATLTNASYIIYDSGTTEKGSGSITPGTGTLTISIPTTYYAVVAENCRVKWTFTASGKVNTFQNLFDVVSTKVCNTVVDADLLKEYPALLNDLPATQSNYSTQIHLAFKKMKNDARSRGDKPHLIIDFSPEPFQDIIVQKALAIIHFNRSREKDDIWWSRYEVHEREYQKLFKNAKFPYDSNDDSVVDEKHNFASIRFAR
jgi:hypothetical protein